jgi:hypothetical protein
MTLCNQFEALDQQEINAIEKIKIIASIFQKKIPRRCSFFFNKRSDEVQRFYNLLANLFEHLDVGLDVKPHQKVDNDNSILDLCMNLTG